MYTDTYYQFKKVDAEDVKVGDHFYDKTDDCLYEIKEIKKIKVGDYDYSLGFVTNPPNKRKNAVIKKQRFSKLSVRKTNY